MMDFVSLYSYLDLSCISIKIHQTPLGRDSSYGTVFISIEYLRLRHRFDRVCEWTKAWGVSKSNEQLLL